MATAGRLLGNASGDGWSGSTVVGIVTIEGIIQGLSIATGGLHSPRVPPGTRVPKEHSLELTAESTQDAPETQLHLF